jgi:hypothetical protein
MIKLNLLRPKFSISMRLLSLALNEVRRRRYGYHSDGKFDIKDELMLFPGDTLQRTLTPLHYDQDGKIDYRWKPRHQRIEAKIRVIRDLYDRGEITMDELDQVSRNIIRDEPNG